MSFNPTNPNGQATMANSAPVTLASNQSDVPVTSKASTLPTATTMQNAATANGNGTSLNVQGFAATVLNVVSSVAMSGGTTINFEGSVDDTTWVSITAHQSGTNTLATTTTADGDFRINTAGYKSVRARISAYSAGTVTIKGYTIAQAGKPTTVNANIVSNTAALPTGANVIGGVTQSGTWTVQPGNTANTTAWKVDGSAVTQPVSLASVPSHAVTNAGTFAVQAASAGDVASGSTDSGNPVKGGGVGRTTNPTAVTDGQRANFITDKLGKQVVVNSIRDLKVVQQTTITSSTSETTILTAVASTFLDLYGLIITNTSATVTKVTIKDSTAGTTRTVIEVPATDTRGFILTESAAIPQATVNNNWTATCGTSVASVEITALAVKNI